MGIYVLQDHNVNDSIDGFALYHERFSSNLIYINSARRNSAAKSFTLAHELAHVFGKRSAISNNYEGDNHVELFCNKFAACLLLPRELLIREIEKRRYVFNTYEKAIANAKEIAARFHVSVSATMVRLSELNFVNQSYVTTFLRGFGDANFADFDKPKSFGGRDGPKPGVVDLAFLGQRAVEAISSACKRELTTSIEIFLRTGLSKKRIEGLLELANERKLVK
jgi:hypothetical protein